MSVVLVDTSVWIDHLHRKNDQLVDLLEADLVVTHEHVLGELACGHLQQRKIFLENLFRLPRLISARWPELITLIETHHLYGLGLSWTDIHLISAALLADVKLWTRDRVLMVAAKKVFPKLL